MHPIKSHTNTRKGTKNNAQNRLTGHDLVHTTTRYASETAGGMTSSYSPSWLEPTCRDHSVAPSGARWGTVAMLYSGLLKDVLPSATSRPAARGTSATLWRDRRLGRDTNQQMTTVKMV